MFGKEAVESLNNPRVVGELTPEQALDQLLAGTCIRYHFVRPSLVALKAQCPAPEEPPAVEVAVPAEPLPPPARMEEVVVRERRLTGSRLPQAGLRSPVPLDVITRPEIELSGHQSLGQILRYIPAVSGNSTSTLVTNGGDGTASVTLRGLPASNTLVLLNGRRLNHDALTGDSVDLNTLPIALIDRIEVLKEGASAVYGSDAVAGVVNVLTRKDLIGWHADAYVGRAAEGDLDTRNFSVSFSEAKETWRLMAGMSYYDQEPAFSRDRSLSASSDDRARGGIDKRSSATAPALFRLPFGAATLSEGFDGSDPTHFRSALGDDRFEYRDYTSLIVPSTRISAFFDAEWDRENVTWFIELLGTRTKSDNTFAPTPLFTGFENLPLIVADDQLYNPFSVELYDVRRRITEAGTRRQTNESETRRAVIGVRGSLDGFNWQMTAQQSRTEAEETLSGAVDAWRVQQALRGAECVSPCVPLNLLGPAGSIDAEMLAYIAARPESSGTSRLRAFNFDFDTGLGWSLPGGEMEVAGGVEYREEWLQTRPAEPLAQGAIIGASNFAPTEGRRTSWEVFAELHLPLLADLPALHRLDVFLAGRLSQYNDFGRETNPRVLLQYQPAPNWTVRASYAHGFRAPNLIELFGGSSQSFEQLNDPCSLAENVSGLVGCQQASDPSLTQFLTQRGGSRGLLPERSRTFTAGVGWQQSFDRWELNAAVDLYRIRQRNVVDTNAQLIINENARGNGFEDAVVRDDNGNITRVRATYLNIGERDVSGIDVTVRASMLTNRFGRFEAALNATHIDRFEDRFDPTQPAMDQAGTFRDDASGGNGALPDWKASLGLNWQRQFWRAQYNLYFVSSLEELVPIVNRKRTMESWHTHNVQVSYLGPRSRWVRVSVGLNNIFDEAPPFSAAAFNDSYDSRTYDITGRYGYLRLERAI